MSAYLVAAQNCSPNKGGNPSASNQATPTGVKTPRSGRGSGAATPTSHQHRGVEAPSSLVSHLLSELLENQQQQSPLPQTTKGKEVSSASRSSSNRHTSSAALFAAVANGEVAPSNHSTPRRNHALQLALEHSMPAELGDRGVVASSRASSTASITPYRKPVTTSTVSAFEDAVHQVRSTLSEKRVGGLSPTILHQEFPRQVAPTELAHHEVVRVSTSHDNNEYVTCDATPPSSSHASRSVEIVTSGPTGTFARASSSLHQVPPTIVRESDYLRNSKCLSPSRAREIGATPGTLAVHPSRGLQYVGYDYSTRMSLGHAPAAEERQFFFSKPEDRAGTPGRRTMSPMRPEFIASYV